MSQKLVIIDYGMGNLWSVKSALRYLGADPVISSDTSTIANADVLILPGVGSFQNAMNKLESQGIVDSLNEAVLGRKRKILGICLGMQLFAQKGTENGECNGLGFIPGVVDRFNFKELGKLKTPHVGFNRVSYSPDSVLFNGMGLDSDFYFVHSYRLLRNGLSGEVASCEYGEDFVAAYEHENIFATQFHPEKSQTNGLRLLSNFLAV